jgi:hypothetical protein
MSRPLKEKLETIRALAEECLAELGSASTTAGKQKKAAPTKSDVSAADVVLRVVNKIGDCDEAATIQKRVLDQRGIEGRLLLPFYIAQKYFDNAWLTSGDVERITSDLGVKINIKNVSNYLVTYRKYLESGAARKRGQPTPYRMNRSGSKRFEEIIHEKP